MIIQPIVAPTLSGLTATPALKGNLLVWDAIDNPLLFSAEVWASQSNDRATATKIATVYDNTFMHLTTSGSKWYYWIRAVSIYQRADGNWYPASSTAGIESTAGLAQTADIANNAITSVSVAQSNSSVTQTNYGAWENVFVLAYVGTGYAFVMDVRHLANTHVTTIGTSQSAKAQQRLTLNEYTVYTTGTVSVTNGSAIVTGTGTSWATSISAGQKFFLLGGPRYTVQTVNSNTQLTLTANYIDATELGKSYYVVTATTPVFTLTQDTTRYEINGSYCISTGQNNFSHRIVVGSTIGKIYDIILDWQLVRDNTTWALDNSSVLRTVILEEIKR
jgi:hypothetical protein